MKAVFTMRMAVLIAVLFLAGCSTSGRVTVPDESTALLTIDRWEARGRVAYRDAAGKGGQASLRWQQQGDESEIRVSGPFGAGGYVLSITPERARLRDSKGEEQIERTGPRAVQDWMRSELGWTFPAQSTRFWLLGIPDPAARHIATRSPDGRVSGLRQFGWTIFYEDFMQVDGVALPRKLVMERDDTRLKIVIGRWML